MTNTIKITTDQLQEQSEHSVETLVATLNSLAKGLSELLPNRETSFGQDNDIILMPLNNKSYCLQIPYNDDQNMCVYFLNNTLYFTLYHNQFVPRHNLVQESELIPLRSFVERSLEANPYDEDTQTKNFEHLDDIVKALSLVSEERLKACQLLAQEIRNRTRQLISQIPGVSEAMGGYLSPEEATELRTKIKYLQNQLEAAKQLSDEQDEIINRLSDVKVKVSRDLLAWCGAGFLVYEIFEKIYHYNPAFFDHLLELLNELNR